jgi:hypothetical protein
LRLKLRCPENNPMTTFLPNFTTNNSQDSLLVTHGYAINYLTQRYLQSEHNKKSRKPNFSLEEGDNDVILSASATRCFYQRVLTFV